MIKTLSPSLPIFILIILSQSFISESRDRHVIKFRSPDVFPESLTYDSSSQNFIVSAIQPGTFHSISFSSSGKTETETETLTLTSSSRNLPSNPSFLGLTVDNNRNRLLAAVNTADKPYLAAFSLHRNSLSLIFLSPLPTPSPCSAVANDVTVDPRGNAYVTNSGENFIWKVTENGTASILSNSSIFTDYSSDRTSMYSSSGLNGVVYVDGKHSSYLLVVQSSTGKMFKVNAVDGAASTVKLPAELTLADGITINKKGVVLVVSINESWMLKSGDEWNEGEVIGKISLERKGFMTGISVGDKGRVYVLYGYNGEGKKGILEGMEIEWFRIEEVLVEGEDDGETVWPFVMIGLALLYFLVWRFQMGRLVKSLDKKRS